MINGSLKDTSARLSAIGMSVGGAAAVGVGAGGSRDGAIGEASASVGNKGDGVADSGLGDVAGIQADRSAIDNRKLNRQIARLTEFIVCIAALSRWEETARF